MVSETLSRTVGQWWTLLVVCLAIFMLLLASGSIADLLGRRRVFVAGLLLFVASSLLCGLAGSPMSAQLDAALANAPLPHRAVNHIAEAVSSGGAEAAARGVPAPVRGLVAESSRRAFIEGLNEILIVAAVLAFVGAALALLLVRRRDFVTGPADAPA